jgi:membrane protease YdiL (CAAX protease family)
MTQFLKAIQVLLAIIIFVAVKYLVIENLGQFEFSQQLAFGYSSVIIQLTYFLSACVFFFILPKTAYDFGFRIEKFNITRIVSIILILQIIPLIASLFLILSKNTLPQTWMSKSLIDIIFIYLFLSPICEEFFFRGLLQTIMAPLENLKLKIFNVKISMPVALSAVMFTLIHIDFSYNALTTFAAIKTIISITFLGLVCGYFREKHKSLLPAIFAHSLYNFFGVFLSKVASTVFN